MSHYVLTKESTVSTRLGWWRLRPQRFISQSSQQTVSSSERTTQFVLENGSWRTLAYRCKVQMISLLSATATASRYLYSFLGLALELRLPPHPTPLLIPPPTAITMLPY